MTVNSTLSDKPVVHLLVTDESNPRYWFFLNDTLMARGTQSMALFFDPKTAAHKAAEALGVSVVEIKLSDHPKLNDHDQSTAYLKDEVLKKSFTEIRANIEQLEKPAIIQENTDQANNDFVLGEHEPSAWIKVKNTVIHIIQNEQAVDIEVLPLGLEGVEPIDQISVSYDYAASFIEQAALDSDNESARLA